MSVQSKISAGLILSTFTLLVVFPNSLVAGCGLVSSIVLFGFLEFLSRKRMDDFQAVESQLKSLKDKVEMIQIGRSMGR